jgi:hypothetical protein
MDGIHRVRRLQQEGNERTEPVFGDKPYLAMSGFDRYSTLAFADEFSLSRAYCSICGNVDNHSAKADNSFCSSLLIDVGTKKG